MLSKRIIPCLDVRDGKVVKGVKFRDHVIVGDILPLAQYYADSGADELVFYDITASSEQRTVSREWITQIARQLNIPFCVAGGISCLADAATILAAGADKISINSPALVNPELINQLAHEFGQQCVVVGIDSMAQGNDYYVYQYTGDVTKTIQTTRTTAAWIAEVQQRGAGEIVLNCMNQDGVRQGYDIKQLTAMREVTQLPLVASGGAGTMAHFQQVFQQAQVDAALAASVFHNRIIEIAALKQFLHSQAIEVRLCH